MILKSCRDLCNIVHKITVSTVRNRSTQIAPLQKASLDERCILVDQFDNVTGAASKKDCHEIGADGTLLLHRAFSVFLFNTNGDLLLQKRSSNKITFPDHYTNSCCSHPLAEIPGETIEKDAIGIRKAAIRRLGYELGISNKNIEISDLFFLTRIYYQATSDGQWGENEIDYVLFLQKDITVNPNPDEVSEIKWVSRSEIGNFIKALKSPLTPWFDLIFKHKLLYWWDNLHKLDKMQDVETITTLK